MILRANHAKKVKNMENAKIAKCTKNAKSQFAPKCENVKNTKIRKKRLFSNYFRHENSNETFRVICKLYATYSMNGYLFNSIDQKTVKSFI